MDPDAQRLHFPEGAAMFFFPNQCACAYSLSSSLGVGSPNAHAQYKILALMRLPVTNPGSRPAHSSPFLHCSTCAPLASSRPTKSTAPTGLLLGRAAVPSSNSRAPKAYISQNAPRRALSAVACQARLHLPEGDAACRPANAHARTHACRPALFREEVEVHSSPGLGATLGERRRCPGCISPQAGWAGSLSRSATRGSRTGQQGAADDCCSLHLTLLLPALVCFAQFWGQATV